MNPSPSPSPVLLGGLAVAGRCRLGAGKLQKVEGEERLRYDGPGWHDLRHHHASVPLSKGVSPALVAERLGHDLKTLLRTYAHVIRQDEDRLRVIVDEARRRR